MRKHTRLSPPSWLQCSWVVVSFPDPSLACVYCTEGLGTRLVEQGRRGRGNCCLCHVKFIIICSLVSRPLCRGGNFADHMEVLIDKFILIQILPLPESANSLDYMTHLPFVAQILLFLLSCLLEGWKGMIVNSPHQFSGGYQILDEIASRMIDVYKLSSHYSPD